MADSKRRPGRPEIGGRVTIALGPLLARIDATRGDRSRAEWLRAAAERALIEGEDVGEMTDTGKESSAERMVDHSLVDELRIEMAVEHALSDHYPLHGGPAGICGGCGWSGQSHTAHLARILGDAGLLASRLPETGVSQPTPLD